MAGPVAWGGIFLLWIIFCLAFLQEDVVAAFGGFTLVKRFYFWGDPPATTCTYLSPQSSESSSCLSPPMGGFSGGAGFRQNSGQEELDDNVVERRRIGIEAKDGSHLNDLTEETETEIEERTSICGSKGEREEEAAGFNTGKDSDAPLKWGQKVVLADFGMLVLAWFFRAPHYFTGWADLLPVPTYPSDGTVALAAALVLFLIPDRPDSTSDASLLPTDAPLNPHLSSPTAGVDTGDDDDAGACEDGNHRRQTQHDRSFEEEKGSLSRASSSLMADETEGEDGGSDSEGEEQVSGKVTISRISNNRGGGGGGGGHAHHRFKEKKQKENRELFRDSFEGAAAEEISELAKRKLARKQQVATQPGRLRKRESSDHIDSRKRSQFEQRSSGLFLPTTAKGRAVRNKAHCSENPLSARFDHFPSSTVSSSSPLPAVLSNSREKTAMRRRTTLDSPVDLSSSHNRFSSTPQQRKQPLVEQPAVLGWEVVKILPWDVIFLLGGGKYSQGARFDFFTLFRRQRH
jgi:hypothetical protein